MLNTNIDGNKNLFYRQAHRVALLCAGFHLLLCIVFGIATDTLGLAMMVGIPALAVPWWMSRIAPTALVSRMAMAVSFMIFTGLIVQQTHGDMEAHFSFFVMMSVLVVYCDWRTIVIAYIAIAVHHLVFTILQPMGFHAIVWGDNRQCSELKQFTAKSTGIFGSFGIA